MANEYVAVTDIKHGNDDGTKVRFSRGETVEGLDGKTMLQLWSVGAIASKGSSADPNTWPENEEVQNTTPRFVEEVLRAQVAAKGAPEGVEVPVTQPGTDPPDNPEELLGLEEEGPDEESDEE